MNPKVKKGFKITGNVLFWIFFVLAISMTIFAFTTKASATGAPKFGDKILMTVKSESMSEKGGFYKGDLIICTVPEEGVAHEYNEGDVVTFQMEIMGENQFNTHRIVTKYEVSPGEYRYETKGDHNPAQDEGSITDRDVLAVWTGKRIPGLGAVIGFLQSQVGFLCCVVLPLGLFFLYEVVQLILIISKMKGKKTMGNISKEQEELIKQKAIEEFLKKQQAENNNSGKGPEANE